MNVSLTADGLKLLLKTDPFASLLAQGFTSFVNGPEASAASINGDTGPSDPLKWVVGRHDQPVHALLNMQSDDPDDLAAEVQKLKTLVTQYGLSIVHEQPGATLPGDLRGHEQFGYKDGISQPGVKGFDPADIGEILLRHWGMSRGIPVRRSSRLANSLWVNRSSKCLVHNRLHRQLI